MSDAPPRLEWESLDRALASGLEDMLVQHWEEVALDRDRFPLVPDWDRYRMLERVGVLRAVSLRTDAGLLGYNVFFVQPTLHYSTSTWAVNDILYLHPDHRKGLAGARLIRGAEPMLATLGVQKVIYHTKLDLYFGHGKARATLGTFLERLGYRHAENVYAKVL
jgi:GNAT superfamily N-acetyltransferase